MKKEYIRKEAIKYFYKDHTYEETIKYLKERYNYSITRMTLFRWIKRIESEEWDFKDVSQRPHKLPNKYSKEEKRIITNIRKKFRYDAKKIKILA